MNDERKIQRWSRASVDTSEHSFFFYYSHSVFLFSSFTSSCKCICARYVQFKFWTKTRNTHWLIVFYFFMKCSLYIVQLQCVYHLQYTHIFNFDAQLAWYRLSSHFRNKQQWTFKPNTQLTYPGKMTRIFAIARGFLLVTRFRKYIVMPEWCLNDEVFY